MKPLNFLIEASHRMHSLRAVKWIVGFKLTKSWKFVHYHVIDSLITARKFVNLVLSGPGVPSKSPCWRRIRFRYNKKLDIIKRELREFIKSLVKEKKYKVKHVIGMNRFLAINCNISENFENHKFY